MIGRSPKPHSDSVLLAAAGVSVVLSVMTAASAETETEVTTLSGYACAKTYRTNRTNAVDLSDAIVTFEDEFDRLSVSGPGGVGPWLAPIHGGFGHAKFLAPHPDRGPFFVSDGALTIRMEKRGEQWVSGLMQTVNAAGRGFSQRYGYFEIRAQFPKGQGTWPAFWLKTVNEFTDPTRTRAEIDIVEAYGGNDWDGHHASVHLWPARRRQPDQLQKHWGKSCYTRIDGDMFDGQWHTYGAEVTPEWVIIYYERRELARFPTLPEFRQPLFLLVDLALLPKEASEAVAAEMKVDYVRVWQRPEWQALSRDGGEPAGATPARPD